MTPTDRGPMRIATEPRHIRTEVYAPALHDRVSMSDGRAGEIIGFYRRTAESVLVRMQSGECLEDLATNVTSLGGTALGKPRPT
jgi:hypothetical protein